MHNSNELIGYMGVTLVAMALLIVLIFQSSTVASKPGHGLLLALVGFCMAVATIADLLLCLAGVAVLTMGLISAVIPNHSGVQAVSVTLASALIIAMGIYIAKLTGKFWSSVKGWAQATAQ